MTVLFGQEHVDRYVATDGEDGHEWEGTQTLLLTTTGRRSGETRVHPLIYGQHGDDYLVVASKGGAPQHPAWYLNLEANPEVEVQVKGDKFKARARTASPGSGRGCGTDRASRPRSAPVRKGASSRGP